MRFVFHSFCNLFSHKVFYLIHESIFFIPIVYEQKCITFFPFMPWRLAHKASHNLHACYALKNVFQQIAVRLTVFRVD